MERENKTEEEKEEDLEEVRKGREGGEGGLGDKRIVIGGRGIVISEVVENCLKDNELL